MARKSFLASYTLLICLPQSILDTLVIPPAQQTMFQPRAFVLSTTHDLSWIFTWLISSVYSSLLSNVTFVGNSSFATIPTPALYTFFITLNKTWYYRLLFICPFVYFVSLLPQCMKADVPVLLVPVRPAPGIVSGSYGHSINICWMNGFFMF